MQKSRLTTAVILFVSIAQQSYADDLLNSPNAGDSSFSALDTEFNEIIDRAAATQQQMDHWAAEFAVEFQVNLNGLTAHERETRPNYQYNSGNADGVIKWMRFGDGRRMELRMNVPAAFMRQDFEDREFVDDGKMQVHHFMRTSQISITSSGPLQTRTPEDLLLPGTGIRRTFAELFQVDSGYRLARAQTSRLGLIAVRIERIEEGQPVRVIDCTLDASMDYAVTMWIERHADRTETTNIQYDKDERGEWYPMIAEKTTVRSDGELIMMQRLTRLATDIPEPVAFEFQPGMIVADNRGAGEFPATAFRVTQSGAWETIDTRSLPVGKTPQKAVLGGLAAAAAAIVVIVIRSLRENRVHRLA